MNLISATAILLILSRARISSVRFFASATLINGNGLWMGDAALADATFANEKYLENQDSRGKQGGMDAIAYEIPIFRCKQYRR